MRMELSCGVVTHTSAVEATQVTESGGESRVRHSPFTRGSPLTMQMPESARLPM